MKRNRRSGIRECPNLRPVNNVAGTTICRAAMAVMNSAAPRPPDAMKPRARQGGHILCWPY